MFRGETLEGVVENRMERRFGWIEACVRYSGGFASKEKKAYASEFDLSPSQVSKDQIAFVDQFNSKMTKPILRVVSGKITLLPGTTMPSEAVYPLPAVEQWLAATIGRAFVIVPPIARVPPDLATLNALSIAIVDRRLVDIAYQSRNTRGTSRRLISPHTIVDIAGRLHVRGYDQGKGRFSDFVIARVASCAVVAHSDGSYVGQELDKDWHRIVQVTIRVRDDLARDGVGREFGIPQSGIRVLMVRAALAPYMLSDQHEGFLSPIVVEMVQAGSGPSFE